MYLISEQFTPGEITALLVFFIITFVLWLLKDTPLGFLWHIYKIFWLALFGTLMANYAKDEVKKWWNK